jgi:HSP20 family protein
MWVKGSPPGGSATDLNISINGNVLTLRGEAKADSHIEGTQYPFEVRRSGAYARSFGLSTGVAADKADAQFVFGILTLLLPRQPELKPKTIIVRAG